jgi:hypothetical protein
MLSDPRLMEASQEVTGTTPEEIAQSADKKRSALEYLITKYAASSGSTSSTSDDADGAGEQGDDDEDDDDDDDDDENDTAVAAQGYSAGDVSAPGGVSMDTDARADSSSSSNSKALKPLRPRHVKLVVASLADNESFIRTNRGPVDRMIMYLKQFFAPHVHQHGEALDIRAHREGSMLTHSHETQYNFVLQSMMLWREIQGKK